jgi:hypothetical protein
MTRKIIHYIAYYADEQNLRNLYSAPSACMKINYIKGVLKEIGYHVVLYSTSWTNNKSGYYKKKIVKIDEKETQIYISTFGAKTKFGRLLRRLWSKVQLIFYLLLKVKNNDTVLVYHSISYYFPLLLLKKFKKVNLILEVEELYSSVFGYTGSLRNRELKIVKIADSYIFSNDLFRKSLNLENKPSITCYGSYSIPKRFKNKLKDGFIHVVYAGIIDSIKQGAFMAVKSANYLPNNYKIHILGFGNERDIKALMQTIESINNKFKYEKVQYHGIKLNQELSDCLHQYHIGLSTLTMEGEYLKYTFPSKILVYLSHGLVTISGNIESVRQSSISNELVYYNENTPESIAKAIMSIDVNVQKDYTEIVKRLDEDFKNKIQKLIDSWYKDN